MQTLKQSRLSVSKVTKKEWKFIMSLAEEEGEPEDSVQGPVEQVSAHANEMETGVLSTPDNSNPAPNGGEDSPANVQSNGILPENPREDDAVGEEGATFGGQAAANNEDLENSLQAAVAAKNVGKSLKKLRPW